jgi:putative hydrolase of the HAD superfamily
MEKNKIKAVLFDLDNTIVDFCKFKKMAIESAVSAMIDSGLNIPRQKIMDTLDKIYKKHGIEYQNVFDDLLKKLISNINPKILASGIVAYRKVKNAYLNPYPSVIPTLVELIKRGYKTGIISDAPRLQVWTRLCDMQLQHFFDVVICFEDSGARKPSILPFKVAIEKLKVKPGEVLMVGDMIERDVLGAQQLGIMTAFAKYGASHTGLIGIRKRKIPKNIKPDYVIHGFEEILKICQNTTG